MIFQALEASQIKFASDIANEFFPHITGDMFQGDVSWVALMRALLPSRIGADAHARMVYHERSIAKEDSDAQYMDELLESVDLQTPNTISVINVRPSEVGMDEIAVAVQRAGIDKHKFAEAVYQRLHAQRTNMHVMMYIDDTINNSVVITHNMTLYLWHLLAAFMRSYFRKEFEEKPFDETEKTMIKLLGSGNLGADDAKTFVKLMAQCAEQYDFKTEEIKRAVGKFTSSTRTRRLKTVENLVNDHNKQLQRLHNEIGTILAQRERLQVQLFGLQVQIANDHADEDLLNYFLNNRSLVFTDSGSGYFSYWVKTRLTNWDEKAAETYINTASSYLYRGVSNWGLDFEKFKTMLRHIFIDRSVRVLMTAAYTMRFDGEEISINIDKHAEPPMETEGYMRNPHSMYNNCWGTAYSNIEEALAAGNYEGAVGVSIYAASELNIVDVSTAQFSEWLAQSEWDCLELPDGTRMTCKAYLETL